MAEEKRGGLSFNTRTWKRVQESTFLGDIPYTPEFLQVLNWKPCECTEECTCHWYGENKGTQCACMADNRECEFEKCKGCERVRGERLTDNTSIQRLGLVPNSTKHEFISDKMGYTLRMEQSIKSGELMIAFAGNIVLENELPLDHVKYSVAVGDWSFRLRKDYGTFIKGKLFKGIFAMDCTDKGTDANFINGTCSHNNAQAYVVVVNGLPIPAVYATKDGKAGKYTL